jgi:Bacterial CdiA-CT RNAse A domain
MPSTVTGVRLERTEWAAMELDGGYDRPRVRPAARRRPPGAPRLRPGAPLTVEPLEVYERNGDGHTLGRHCGSTPALESQRLARHPELPATGSFTDVATAQRAVDACVVTNRDEVVSWRAEQRQRLVIDHDMKEVIGGVLTRSRWAAGDTMPLPASALRVVLRRHTGYASGFSVLTAYPRLP